jgi:hypothetical protein
MRLNSKIAKQRIKLHIGGTDKDNALEDGGVSNCRYTPNEMSWYAIDW